MKHDPLTDQQRNRIAELALAGMGDREIAGDIGSTEYRVQYWRAKMGIDASARRREGGRIAHAANNTKLRPKHVIGHWPEGDYFDSQNAAFEAAMIAELQARESGNVE